MNFNDLFTAVPLNLTVEPTDSHQVTHLEWNHHEIKPSIPEFQIDSTVKTSRFVVDFSLNTTEISDSSV
jgi:hypothetical protein